MVKTSAENVVPMLADSTKSDQNRDPREKYKGEAYPTLIFVAPAGSKQVPGHAKKKKAPGRGLPRGSFGESRGHGRRAVARALFPRWPRDCVKIPRRR